MKRTITGTLGALLLLGNGHALAATTPVMGQASLSVSAQIHLSRIEPDQAPTTITLRSALARDAARR